MDTPCLVSDPIADASSTLVTPRAAATATITASPNTISLGSKLQSNNHLESGTTVALLDPIANVDPISIPNARLSSATASLDNLAWTPQPPSQVADSSINPFLADSVSGARQLPWAPSSLTLDVSAATLPLSASLPLSAHSNSLSSVQSTSPLAIFSSYGSASGQGLGSTLSSATSSPPTSSNESRLSPTTLPGERRSRKQPRERTMAGRPSTKRASDGPDNSYNDNVSLSTSDSSQSGGKMKLPRLDRGQEDFSSVVKNRLQSYTRTGQACDRCKVRKIRCDALPEGCSHCINLDLECYVTDRVTGRTERRGYMQQLEREKNGMVTHIRDLEKLLRDNGVEVRPFKEPKTAKEPHEVDGKSTETQMSETNGDEDNASGKSTRSSLSGEWAKVGSLWVKNYTERAHYIPSFPRSQLEARPDDHRPRPNGPLSSVRGTRLSILGTTIDTTSFESPDTDEPPEGSEIVPLYNKSVQAYLQSTMRVNPPVQISLPSREDAFNYCEWYFMTVARFLPILHKPSFMTLLAQMYDDPNFKPSAPELATVHIILAIIYFQYGSRNWQQAEQRHHLNELSNKHYHFAIGMMYELRCSRDLAAAQALALIASHTRSFPKPGCGTIVSPLALQKAIDMNLHRATKQPGEPTNLENELRKRVWWAIVMVVVASTGRRGLPVPISVEDFDVDFPEAIADELLTETGVDKTKTMECPYEAGIAAFKITPTYMEVYSNMYSVRRDTSNYATVIKALEKQLKDWEDNLPESLQLKQPGDLDHYSIEALYMRIVGLEVRLSLRHPSATLTTDKKLMAENTRICEEVADDFLQCIRQIEKKKSLDTTWYGMSVYTGCIFSTLAGHWERRFQSTQEHVSKLRKDMDEWIVVLKEMSLLLGSGMGVATEISNIVNRTIRWIEHDMIQSDTGRKQSQPTVPVTIKEEPPEKMKKTSAVKTRVKKPLPTSSPLKKRKQQQKQQEQATTQPHDQPRQQPQQQHTQTESVANPQTIPVSAEHTAAKGYYQPQTVHEQANYNGMSYNEAHAQQNVAVQQTYQPEPHDMFYARATQATEAGSMVNAGMPGNPLIAFATQTAPPLSSQDAQNYMWQGRGNTWQDWTAAIADTQDRYGANTLLTLGGAGGRVPMESAMVMGDPSMMNQGEMPHADPAAPQWPMAIFDHTASTAGSG